MALNILLLWECLCVSSLSKFVVAVTKIVELVVFLHGINCNPISTTPMMVWTPNLQFERKRIAL